MQETFSEGRRSRRFDPVQHVIYLGCVRVCGKWKGERRAVVGGVPADAQVDSKR